MIEVNNLVKRYGENLAVDGLSFTVEEGQIYGFLGPNGAGKSTTLNIMTGCLAATSGEVRIDGFDIFKQARQAKSAIGYLPEQPPLYPDMTPREYLSFVAQIKGIPSKMRAEAIQTVMTETDILDVQDRLIKNLSKGYKQRVGLAQAILGDAKVVILDEPTVGLDPAQIIEIRNVIRSLAPKHTVIFSSHILSEVSEICSRILIISKGKLIAEGSPEELSSRFITNPVLQATVSGNEDTVREVLDQIEQVDRYEVSAGDAEGTVELTITCQNNTDVKETLSRMLAAQNCFILRLEESKASLEDVFMELIAQDETAAEDDEDALPQDDTLEVDADDLLSGNMESVFDEHSAFDSPLPDDENSQNESDELPEEETPELETEEGSDDVGDL